MNFFLAWLGALAMPTAEVLSPTMAIVQQFLIYFMLANVVLGLFNLLPIPPLDGGRIAVGLLPLKLARVWARLERAGILIVLLVLFVLPHFTGFDPVGEALGRLLPWAFRTLFWLAGHGTNGPDGNLI
jgi:Zn-dependent protease